MTVAWAPSCGWKDNTTSLSIRYWAGLMEPDVGIGFVTRLFTQIRKFFTVCSWLLGSRMRPAKWKALHYHPCCLVTTGKNLVLFLFWIQGLTNWGLIHTEKGFVCVNKVVLFQTYVHVGTFYKIFSHIQDIKNDNINSRLNLVADI